MFTFTVKGSLEGSVKEGHFAPLLETGPIEFSRQNIGLIPLRAEEGWQYDENERQ